MFAQENMFFLLKIKIILYNNKYLTPHKRFCAKV